MRIVVVWNWTRKPMTPRDGLSLVAVKRRFEHLLPIFSPIEGVATAPE